MAAGEIEILLEVCGFNLNEGVKITVIQVYIMPSESDMKAATELGTG